MKKTGCAPSTHSKSNPFRGRKDTIANAARYLTKDQADIEDHYDSLPLLVGERFFSSANTLAFGVMTLGESVKARILGLGVSGARER